MRQSRKLGIDGQNGYIQFSIIGGQPNVAITFTNVKTKEETVITMDNAGSKQITIENKFKKGSYILSGGGLQADLPVSIYNKMVLDLTNVPQVITVTINGAATETVTITGTTNSGASYSKTVTLSSGTAKLTMDRGTYTFTGSKSSTIKTAPKVVISGGTTVNLWGNVIPLIWFGRWGTVGHTHSKSGYDTSTKRGISSSQFKFDGDYLYCQYDCVINGDNKTGTYGGGPLFDSATYSNKKLKVLGKVGGNSKINFGDSTLSNKLITTESTITNSINGTGSIKIGVYVTISTSLKYFGNGEYWSTGAGNAKMYIKAAWIE